MFGFKITGLVVGLIASIGVATSTNATDLPTDDPGLFSYLFSQKTIPAEWISEPANEELTPAMMSEIAIRLSADGGEYENATKSARGWVLDFQNGTARARIVRATDHKIIGVFFSRLE